MYSANLPNTNMTGTKTATSSVVIRMQITIRLMLHAMHLNPNLTAEGTQLNIHQAEKCREYGKYTAQGYCKDGNYTDSQKVV